MSVDIFTIIIQIFNFLILIFILNKIIYRPLIKLMKDRKEYISSNINDAEEKLKEAESLKMEYQSKLEEIKEYKIEQIKIIDTENNKYKNEQLELIKNEIEEEKRKFLNELEKEKNSILDNVAKNIFLNVNNLLNDIFVYLTDKSFNEVILIKFLNEIKNLPETEISKINRTIKDKIDFISNFDININQKEIVERTFKEKNIFYKTINFLKDESMVLGNKIVIDGLIINSNVKDIIDQFNIKLEQIV